LPHDPDKVLAHHKLSNKDFNDPHQGALCEGKIPRLTNEDKMAVIKEEDARKKSDYRS
jgi:hypothetical protein